MNPGGEPTWVRPDTLRAIHQRQLAEHGGAAGIRDAGLLESALFLPVQAWTYDPSMDLASLAASLAWGLLRNHPFGDGNKRTAYVACRLFLALNGADLEATKEEKYLTFLALTERRIDEAAFATWLRERLIPTSARAG